MALEIKWRTLLKCLAAIAALIVAVPVLSWLRSCVLCFFYVFSLPGFFQQPFRADVWQRGDIGDRGTMMSAFQKHANQLLAGKTVPQVEALLGKPEGTKLMSGDSDTVEYRFLSNDPLDMSFVLIHFQNHQFKAIEVQWDTGDYTDQLAFDKESWRKADLADRGKMTTELTRQLPKLLADKDEQAAESLLGKPDLIPTDGALGYRYTVGGPNGKLYLVVIFRDHHYLSLLNGATHITNEDIESIRRSIPPQQERGAQAKPTSQSARAKL